MKKISSHPPFDCDYARLQFQNVMAYGFRDFSHADEICCQLHFDALGVGFNRRPSKWRPR